MTILINFQGTTIEKLKTYNPSILPSRRPTRPLFSPDPNKKCRFPYTYQGEVYTTCLSGKGPGVTWAGHFPSIDKPYWCPTELYENHYLIDGKWGYCSNTCVEKEVPDRRMDDELPGRRTVDGFPDYEEQVVPF